MRTNEWDGGKLPEGKVFVGKKKEAASKWFSLEVKSGLAK